MTPNGVKQRLAKKLFNDADDANRRQKKKHVNLTSTGEWVYKNQAAANVLMNSDKVVRFFTPSSISNLDS